MERNVLTEDDLIQLIRSCTDVEERRRLTMALGNLQSEGVPGYVSYQRESLHTQEWYCPTCGTGPIPCAQYQCPGCQDKRPMANRDPEVDGIKVGYLRAKAGQRNDR